MNIVEKIEQHMRERWDFLELAEKAVLRLLWTAWVEETGKITQGDIAKSQEWLGCHPKYESDVVRNKRESTLRQVRQIIRNLRIDHKIPILSDNKGYWIPRTESEVIEYVERMEKIAKAQAASWHQTYRAVSETLNVTSSFFDQFSGIEE